MKRFSLIMMGILLLLAFFNANLSGAWLLKTAHAASRKEALPITFTTSYSRAEAASTVKPANCWQEADNESIYGDKGVRLGYTILWHNICTGVGHEQTVAVVYHYQIHAGLWHNCDDISVGADGATENSVDTTDIGWIDGCMDGDGIIDNYSALTYA